jgi:hypothetical protein
MNSEAHWVPEESYSYYETRIEFNEKEIKGGVLSFQIENVLL